VAKCYFSRIHVIILSVADVIIGWMVDAESRPTFTELYAEFSKMSKDPGRYLVTSVRLKKAITSAVAVIADRTAYNVRYSY